VCTWIFRAVSVADDEQRVAQRLQLGLEGLPVEPLALDDEDGAIAVARELLVDRVETELLPVLRRLGDRFAGDPRGEATDDLEQACAAGVDDARLSQDGELVRRPRKRVLAACDDRRQELRQQQIGRRPLLGLPRPARG